MRRSGRTTLYRFHDLALEVNYEESMPSVGLSSLLKDLSFARFHAGAVSTSLWLFVRMRDQVVHSPDAAREVFRIEGVYGREEETTAICRK